MAYYVEFESEFGLIKIETQVRNSSAMRDFSAGDKLAVKAKEGFEQSLSTLTRLTDAVMSKLNQTAQAHKPDEVEIKLGLTFSAEAGAIIAKTSAEGNLEITIKWKGDSLASSIDKAHGS